MGVYHKRSFIAFLALSWCMWALEYLEVLNLYNCEAWYCGGTGMFVLLCHVVLAVRYRENIGLFWPTMLVHLFLGGGLVFWDVERWNITTRHRTEYYDTHDTYCALLFMTHILAIYRYYDVEHQLLWQESQLRELRSELVEKVTDEVLNNDHHTTHKVVAHRINVDPFDQSVDYYQKTPPTLPALQDPRVLPSLSVTPPLDPIRPQRKLQSPPPSLSPPRSTPGVSEEDSSRPSSDSSGPSTVVCTPPTTPVDV